MSTPRVASSTDSRSRHALILHRSISPTQVSWVRRFLHQAGLTGLKVDQPARTSRFSSVQKLRHFISKLRRLDLTKADREVTALKKQFRREDLELLAQGRGDEIAARNRRLMGIKDGAKTRLVGYNGVRFE